MNNADLKSYNSKRKIVQLGFVTNDYKKTIAYLYERLLIGPWVIMEHKSGVTKIKELHGKPVNEPFRFYCASAMLGDMEFEVIQPDYGPNPYSEFLETRGPGIHHVADGLFCREIDGLFCRSSPDIIVRRRCVLSHKRRGWLQPSPSFRYSRNLALQDELYHPVINNGPAVLVCVDKRLGTGPVNQSRDAG